MAEKENGGSAKAFGAIVAIIAVIAGIYAMVEPMNLRIDSLENANHALAIKIDKLQENTAQYYSLKTDIVGLSGKVKDLDDWLKWWREEYPMLNATQDEKIKRLEWYIYGKASGEMFENRWPIIEE